MPSFTWTTSCWPPVRSKAFRDCDLTDQTAAFRKFRHAYCAELRNLRLRHLVPYPEESPSGGATIKSVAFVLHPRIDTRHDTSKHHDALRLLCMRYANFHCHGNMPDYSIVIGDVADSPHGLLETTLTW